MKNITNIKKKIKGKEGKAKEEMRVGVGVGESVGSVLS